MPYIYIDTYIFDVADQIFLVINFVKYLEYTKFNLKLWSNQLQKFV